ncbi:MAG: F0F1 ATP synthase subunit A [Alphaproteobacteria bacterium]|nr:F0F1 ATP synthase subunit A [Alphaproteobacteria bacterium]
MAGPLAQFEIKPLLEIRLPEVLGGYDISFTNSALWMLLSISAVSFFLLVGIRKRESNAPGRWQGSVESCYEFIANLVNDNIGEEGRRFLPIIFTLFLFILFGNLLGMIPYSFTFTSHIIVTFAMALVVFIGVTLLGIFTHGLHFFSSFVPQGAPSVLVPFMIVIEIISYLSRPVSLSIRLFANMMAGHTMMKVFAGFVISLGAATFGIGAIAPLAMTVVLTGFEILVAFLQAYVFAVLTCLYINDALHLH